MEDPTFFTQYETTNPIEYPFDDFNFQSESYSSYPKINGSSINEASHHQLDVLERPPLKQLKTNNWSSCIAPPKASFSSSSSHIISFNNSSSSLLYYGVDCDLKPETEIWGQVSKMVGSLTRAPLLAQEHVLAERKRREKISQSFLSLAALIPGLKKKDKNSVLGDAIEYLKQLQERKARLEEQVAKRTVESVKFVKKTTQFYAQDDQTSSSDENFGTQSKNPFPDIEARVSNKDVLIRIHCETNKGCISNIINEVEKLHLSVLNSNALPFGQATLYITIVAQMEDEFSMTLRDVVKTLREGLLNFM
ncbi:transcription factor bHLH18 [Gossypium hirsutum]|uniref:Transcription factor bHLH18 n=1 Tax=Gossypium hirsutum TaxID=3635 RepID=A0ABM2Z471_GOSHI|nr:transcription factor bHLH18-like [Gossypium hirsutum]